MKVCMVVPNAMVKGGIAAVVNGYKGSQLERDFDIRYVESYCDGSKAKKLLKGISGYFCFLAEMIMFRPDIIHIHSSFGPSFYRKIPFIYMAAWAKKPIINHIHGADFDEFYTKASEKKRKLIKKIYLKCDRLIALSDEWKDNLSQIVPASHITVIENYSNVHEEAFAERQRRKTNNTVLFLGEIGKRKGCYDIPDVVEKVAAAIPDVCFVLAGDGADEDKSAIKSLLKAKGVEKNVIFPGWVRDLQKDELLRKSDVFFLPSYNEGMPMSVLDAMGYGLPIVSTNVGGIPKIVREEMNGFCFRPGECDRMANAIISLLKNENLLNGYSQVSYDIICKEYSRSIHLKKIDSLYRTYDK